MSKELWVSEDLTQIVRDKLRFIFKDEDKTIFVSDVPDKWTSSKPPVVTIQSDGQSRNEPSWTREVVRITVHAKDVPTARKIMGHVDAALLTPLSLGVLVQIRAGGGIFALKDSKLGGGMASATYNVVAAKVATRQLNIKEM